MTDPERHLADLDTSTASSAVDVCVYKDHPAALEQLSTLLRQGEVVAIPTETVYGLAAHALDPQACRRIFEIKGRPLIDPLIVHVADLAAAESLAYFNPEARRLAATFWPGPLTLVLPKKDPVPAIVTAGLDSVALRVPRHPAMHNLLVASGLPLAAPSANPFGYISPTTPAHVITSLKGRIQYLLDGGPCDIGVESTIVDLCDPLRPRLLRPGGLPLEAIEHALGKTLEQVGAAGEQPELISAPGLLKRHYSPRKSLRLFPVGHIPNLAELPPSSALLLQARPSARTPLSPQIYWLSEQGDPATCARHLFDLLRQLDTTPQWTEVWAEMAHPEGLGLAINDRLTRAAAR